MAYDNKMSGVLFRNKKKEHDKQPDHTGQCEVNGVEYWLSAWIQESPKSKFFRLKFKPKEEEAPAVKKKATPPSHGFEDMDSDIPF